MKKLLACLALPLTLATLSGCNAGAIALAAYSSHGLDTTSLSGVVANATADTRVGYITWIEQLQDGNVQGKLNFDLVQDKTVSFDKVVTPDSSGKFTLALAPAAKVQEGRYVVFAWTDSNHNNVYDGDQGEKRAPEVYRLTGDAGVTSTWTTEKFVFTDQQLSIQYADQNGGLAFTF